MVCSVVTSFSQSMTTANRNIFDRVFSNSIFRISWPHSTAMGNLAAKMHERLDLPEDHGVTFIRMSVGE